MLLTATPHMGKDYPYYCLWRLLEPNVLATKEAFDAYPAEARQRHFIRRTKEEMVTLDGKPLYPERISDTLSYDLTQGPNSEQHLYDETTEYLQSVYNRAKLLNRSAARLAMSVFQRRLASSTYALMRSFERRIAKLDGLIADVEDGKLTMDQLLRLQQQIAEEGDVLDIEDRRRRDHRRRSGRERSRRGPAAAGRHRRLVWTICGPSATRSKKLLDLARRVHDDKHMESKFERLREIITDPKYAQEKLLDLHRAPRHARFTLSAAWKAWAIPARSPRFTAGCTTRSGRSRSNCSASRWPRAGRGSWWRPTRRAKASISSSAGS